MLHACFLTLAASFRVGSYTLAPAPAPNSGAGIVIACHDGKFGSPHTTYAGFAELFILLAGLAAKIGLRVTYPINGS